MNNSKEDIIKDGYFDKRGFGSSATTLKDSRAKDKSITMADIEALFKKNVEQKTKMR